MTVQYVDNGNPDGAVLGQDATEKIAFYGKTPVVQPTSASQAAVAATVVTTASTTTTPAGYATTTQATNIATIVDATRTLVNQLRSDLVTLGLIKGA